MKKIKINKQLSISHLLLLVLLTSSSCAHHQENNSMHTTPQILNEQSLSKEETTRFWSAVKPILNLPLSHYRLGRYYQKGNKHELAIKEFTKAINLNQEYVQAYNALGMSYDQLANCKGAEWAYGQALQYGPDKAYIYNNFGCSRLLCNEAAQAVTLLTTAHEMDSSNSRIANNLQLAKIRSNSHGENTSSLPEESLTATNQKDYGQEPTSGIRPDTAMTKDSPFVEQTMATKKKTEAHKIKVSSSKNKQMAVVKDMQKAKPHCAVEISNGNGVTGMAKRGAGYLRKLGFSVKRITNAPKFTVRDSKIYYRDGCLALAEAVAKVVPGSQEFEKVNDLGRAEIGVRLTLGGDMRILRFPEGLSRHFDKSSYSK